MQMVINIPEEAYNWFKIIGPDWYGARYILDAVSNGTPLPKGHGRLIDVNNLHTVLDCHMYNIDGIHKIIDTDEDIKTIIEADKED